MLIMIMILFNKVGILLKIDDFLDSDKSIEQVGEYTILKIKYNENIDFIYEPSYGEFEYGNELRFLGFFEKVTKKLYGSSFDFHSEYDENMYSNYYESSIDKIGKSIKDGVDMYLNKYVEENKLQLMNIGKEIFDKYIATDWNYNNIKNNTIKDYIYGEQNSKISFSINSSCYERNIKKLIIKYVQNPIETTKNIFNDYINNEEKIESAYFNNKYNKVSVKEHLGVFLLEKQLRDTLLQELKDNPNNDYKKKHDIIQSIKDLDAQMVTITLKHNDEIIDFKYPKRILNNLDFYESHIPDLKTRDKVEQLYKGIYGKDDLFIKEIVKIEYKKKVLYEDKELLKSNENDTKNMQETHDIVDDMFD